MRAKHRAKKRVASADRRHRFLNVERLEDRLLLASDPANVFAKFSGSISEVGEQDTVPVHLTSDNFTIDGGHATLGIEVIPAQGSPLVPDVVSIDSIGPGNVPTIYAQSGLAGGSSLVLAKFKHGDFNVHVTGAGGTTGDWTMRIFLAGDVTGDFVVDDTDKSLLNDVKNGRIPASDILAEGDANRDGKITGFDVARAASNKGVATSVRVLTVTAFLDPASETGLPNDNLVNQTPVNVVGVTLEGANVSLDEDGDGFDDGTTIATALVGTTNYSLSADLVSGTNTLGVEARDSFGQIAQAQTTVTLDVVPPTVVSTSPGEGTEVEPESGQDVPVEIVFSESMIGSSVVAALAVSGNETGTITPLNPSYDDATNTLSFDLSEALTDSAISVTVADSATDIAGNTLGGGPFVLNFSINRVTTITQVSPANGEGMVSLTREAIVRFSSAHDSLFSQYGRSDALQLGDNGLRASSRQDHAAPVGLITLDRNKSRLIDRVHANTHDLDGADDDDELDLLIRYLAELRADGKSGVIEQLL
jgi:hypothetical protein